MIYLSVTSQCAISFISSPTTWSTPRTRGNRLLSSCHRLRPCLDDGNHPTEEVYREMMGRISSPSQIKAITMVLNDNVRFNKEKERYADIKNIDFSLFRSLVQKVVDRILEIELKRGDSETQVTPLQKN